MLLWGKSIVSVLQELSSIFSLRMPNIRRLFQLCNGVFMIATTVYTRIADWGVSSRLRRQDHVIEGYSRNAKINGNIYTQHGIGICILEHPWHIKKLNLLKVPYLSVIWLTQTNIHKMVIFYIKIHFDMSTYMHLLNSNSKTSISSKARRGHTCWFIKTKNKHMQNGILNKLRIMERS